MVNLNDKNPSELTHDKTPQDPRKNILIEGNEIKESRYNIFIKNMDKYVNIIDLIIFCVLGFFLFYNLGIFLWLHIVVTIYMIIYRILKFSATRSAMYLLEFCYYGNLLLICYLIFFGQSIKVFYTAFIPSTGIIAIANLLFSNPTPFDLTDYLTSSSIHTFPLLTVWAIRWRHKLYTVDSSSDYFSLLRFDEDSINNRADSISYGNFSLYQVYPILLWLIWAFLYFIINSTILSKYVNNPKYNSCIKDFFDHRENLKFLFGDLTRFTLLKYILNHFMWFASSMLISLACYYYFIANTIYAIFILGFLTFNSARIWLRIRKAKNELRSKVQGDANV